MPIFHLHFSDGHQTFPNDIGIDFPDLEKAYLAVCADIPERARELMLERQDPLGAAYIIADSKGQVLLTVPFTDVLSPAEWRVAKVRRRPHGGPRSTAARDRLALTSFRRMFGMVNAGCVLLTPEMSVVEMNDFGARHSHVDPDAIRGMPITDIFADLKGEPKDNFLKFMGLAQAGLVSEVLDLPYLVLNEDGQTANGWWDARTWPIFDDDKRVIGFVEWASPSTTPAHGGTTKLRTSALPSS